MKNISRRSFLKGALAGIAGTALTSALSGCRLIIPEDKPLKHPDYEGSRYSDDDLDAVYNGEHEGGEEIDLTTTPPDSGVEAVAWDVRHTLNLDFTPADGLELPVVGATGFASVEMYQWRDFPASNACKIASLDASFANNVAVQLLSAGTPFIVLDEQGDWWLVRANSQIGWVEHRYCLINLPDVIPSMAFDDTNAYASIFRASGKDIPNITDRALYSARAYNARLGREEFVMPVLYAMSKKICRAQHNALAEGNTLVLYEGFRPYEAQIKVAQEVYSLARVDSDVNRGINSGSWSISWFIATGISNHQEGYAMDVGLAKVTGAHVDTIDGCNYIRVEPDGYEYYTMPSPMHELSVWSCTYTRPVTIGSKTAWQSAAMTTAMSASEPGRALQRYCTGADMTPLASEWWHFNDLDAYWATSARRSTGKYYIETAKCDSRAPSSVQY